MIAIPHPLLIGLGLATLGGGAYWWSKRSKASPTYTPSAPSPTVQPGYTPTPDPGFVDQNPGTSLSTADPLAPKGGYTPGGYNPWTNSQPTYQNPLSDPGPANYPTQAPPESDVPLASLDPANWNPLDPGFWVSGEAPHIQRGAARRRATARLLG